MSARCDSVNGSLRCIREQGHARRKGHLADLGGGRVATWGVWEPRRCRSRIGNHRRDRCERGLLHRGPHRKDGTSWGMAYWPEGWQRVLNLPLFVVGKINGRGSGVLWPKESP